MIDKTHIIFLIMTFFYLSNGGSFYAQTDTTKTINESDIEKKISGTIGIGGGSLGRIFHANLSFHENRNIYALRYLFITEGKIGIDFSNHSEPYEKISELGIYYGRQRKWNKRLKGTIGLGISYVQGIKRGKYVYTKKTFFAEIDYHEQIQFYSAGLLADAKIVFGAGRYFNFTLNGVADLNLYKSFYGIGFGMGFNMPFKKNKNHE